MTAQVPDTLQYDDHSYSIAAIERDWPFHPDALGLREGQPAAACTACWRGHVGHYAVRDGRLYLVRLGLLAGPNPPSAWDGIPPGDKPDSMGLWEYQDLFHPVPYSGGVVIAREFIQEFYVHMGFQHPIGYEVVHELRFDRGALQSATDHSARMAELRHLVRSGHPEQAGISCCSTNVARLIEDAFSLSYEKKWR
ncbi:MAG TPA: hypothetical protein PKN61_05650 [Acidobacteriota bacterium]|mgnify:FL=1|nr:hypothetical protein [Acidobacteriota bacterium]HNR38502.1 hypothetical protein [Acidobacteriota bacterium]HNT99407.1 hypothetical protein [Acidobacteriota bacterium]HQO27258.1 hypothetical protein [Acidobacteriota bacterium]HQP75516.1 hypothetical protein [Acidobacteriota bacterium]